MCGQLYRVLGNLCLTSPEILISNKNEKTQPLLILEYVALAILFF